ncbi:sensor histidine kinase [Loktanella sp. M215]|uniref:sensor histidine kinase n=1 Tax=Loktanella sp. M215 TaxID=2675431 RepID=UPI001F1F5E48|nr:sensor histidine kinase [Loktanella sp. M215]
MGREIRNVSQPCTLTGEGDFMCQLKDFADATIQSITQRVVTYTAALVLAGFYYSVQLAMANAVLVIVSEIYDYSVLRRIVRWDGKGAKTARSLYIQLMVATVISAINIIFYAIGIALIQGPGSHFISLFFLFSAAIFAAMSNHQVMSVLVLRLTAYGLAFVFIPVYDVYTTGAGIHSELWAQLFASFFVLYFVVDCSRIHRALYRQSKLQLDELRDQQKTTTDALRIKTDFLSTMSHELRTPLTSIRGSIDIIGSGHFGELPDRIRSVVSIAQRNCGILITLINDILDLQKIEFGNMNYNMEKLDIVDLINHSISVNAPYADQLGVTLDFDGKSKPVFVHGDFQRLSQVLSNILSNAAKFSPRDSTVKITVFEHVGRIRISVRDTGIGLEESEAPKVFDRFSQIDASESRNFSGTGLGMNISRRIMEAHDGLIGYTKNSGPGTTFFVELDKARQSEVLPPSLQIDDLSASRLNHFTARSAARQVKDTAS